MTWPRRLTVAFVLLVLCVNSIVAIQRGLTGAAGELSLWAALGVFMTAVSLALLSSIQDAPAT